MSLLIPIVLIVLVVLLIHKLKPMLIVDFKNLGAWAVVTGATDGIGKAFAQELAKMGYNIVLVSRNIYKLEDVAKEIKANSSVETKVVQADFSSSDKEMFSRIEKSLSGLDIGILVNNVGTTSVCPEKFLDLENIEGAEWYQNTLNCNILSAVNMTRLVLPGMVERRRGLTINVSSVFSLLPSPLHSLYGATKAFLTKFSQDLDLEYNDKNVHIHVLTPGLVTTNLSGVRKPTIYGPDPTTYVKSALKQVAYYQCCDGYTTHAALRMTLQFAMSLFPDYVGNGIQKYLYKIRKIYWKRRNQKKTQNGNADERPSSK